MYDHILVERIHIVALVAVDLYSELVVERILVVDHTLERVLVVKKLCTLTLVYEYSIHSELVLLLAVDQVRQQRGLLWITVDYGRKWLTQSGFDCRIGGAIVIIVVFLQRLLWIYTVRKNFLTVAVRGIV